MTRGGRSPAEVDVVAEDRELVVEPAELLQDPPADQHPGGVDGQHGARLGVLALVVLSALQPGLPPTGAGDRHPELEQAPKRRPLPQHRAEDVGVGLLGGAGEQGQQRLGMGTRVVVQQPHPLRFHPEPTKTLQAQPHCRGEGRGGRGPHDLLVSERLSEEARALVLAPGVDGAGAGHRRLLCRDGLEHGRQPPRSVVADQDEGHVLTAALHHWRVTRIGDGHDRPP
jgi:hypothetical protein